MYNHEKEIDAVIDRPNMIHMAVQSSGRNRMDDKPVQLHYATMAVRSSGRNRLDDSTFDNVSGIGSIMKRLKESIKKKLC